MKSSANLNYFTILGIVSCLLIATVFLAGCTSSSPAPVTAAATIVTAAPSDPAAPVATTVEAVPVSTHAAAATTAVQAETTEPVTTPKPTYTYSEGNVVAYTAASLSGVSPKLAADFSKMYPGHTVTFNLDGTQALKTQVVNGAYADVFISASNAYTKELTTGGYFVTDSIKPLTSNYVIVILPAKNTANIKSLSDLSKPGLKIAMADKSVPVGTATAAVLANLAKSTEYGKDWNASVYDSVVTYETSEPAVASKVQLGEVDAGFVYESTYIAGTDKYRAITIPRTVNYLQTYTIGVMKQSTSKGAAADFENFLLSSVGQLDLEDYGFRPL